MPGPMDLPWYFDEQGGMLEKRALAPLALGAISLGARPRAEPGRPN